MAPTCRRPRPRTFQADPGRQRRPTGGEPSPDLQLQRIYGDRIRETPRPFREAATSSILAEAGDGGTTDKIGADLDLFHFPTGDRRGAPGVPPEGRADPPADGGLLPQMHRRTATSRFGRPTSRSRRSMRSQATWLVHGGHVPPMEMEGATYYPKPMNCPMHILIYKDRQRSYRELPLRLSSSAPSTASSAPECCTA